MAAPYGQRTDEDRHQTADVVHLMVEEDRLLIGEDRPLIGEDRPLMIGEMAGGALHLQMVDEGRHLTEEGVLLHQMEEGVLHQETEGTQMTGIDRGAHLLTTVKTGVPQEGGPLPPVYTAPQIRRPPAHARGAPRF